MSTASILKVQAILFGNSKRGYTVEATNLYFHPLFFPFQDKFKNLSLKKKGGVV